MLVRQDSAAEREETAPMRLTGRVKTRNGSCVRGRGGELIHGTTAAWGTCMVEPTAASDPMHESGDTVRTVSPTANPDPTTISDAQWKVAYDLARRFVPMVEAEEKKMAPPDLIEVCESSYIRQQWRTSSSCFSRFETRFYRL